MQCKQIREQVTDYVNNAIEEPSRSQVQQHLIVCDKCRTEVEEMKTLWTSLGSIHTVEPGPELQPRFQIMLEAYKDGLEQGRTNHWWADVNLWVSRWWPRRPVVQLLVSAGLLILGVMIGRQIHPASASPTLQSNSEVAQLRSDLSQMRQIVALSLMQQQSASERLKGVNWSYQLQQPGGEVLKALLDTLMHDPNVNVRLATVDALRQFGNQTVVRRGVIEAMAHEESPMVQLALIDLAVDLREKSSIDTLRQLTHNEKVDDAVRVRAQKGLTELE
jgi:hypothetical protein